MTNKKMAESMNTVVVTHDSLSTMRSSVDFAIGVLNGIIKHYGMPEYRKDQIETEITHLKSVVQLLEGLEKGNTDEQ